MPDCVRVCRDLLQLFVGDSEILERDVAVEHLQAFTTAVEGRAPCGAAERISHSFARRFCFRWASNRNDMTSVVKQAICEMAAHEARCSGDQRWPVRDTYDGVSSTGA